MTDDRVRIVFQMRRLAAVGFLRLPGPAGQDEFIRALAALDPDLLELAVSRWIERSTSKYFPFPGELRAMVDEEIGRRASELASAWRPARLQGHHPGCSCGHCSYFFPETRKLTVIEGGR